MENVYYLDRSLYTNPTNVVIFIADENRTIRIYHDEAETSVDLHGNVNPVAWGRWRVSRHEALSYLCDWLQKGI